MSKAGAKAGKMERSASTLQTTSKSSNKSNVRLTVLKKLFHCSWHIHEKAVKAIPHSVYNLIFVSLCVKE